MRTVPTKQPGLATETILLVDDHDDGRNACETLLRHFGYAVHAATNGEEAVRQATEILPELVLMDLRMPVMDGWAAAERLREDRRTRGIPILALTADHVAATDIARSSVLFDGWITKPFTAAVLLSEVRRVLAPADA
jgi:two-component system, cell cycle response regulator DivK